MITGAFLVPFPPFGQCVNRMNSTDGSPRRWPFWQYGFIECTPLLLPHTSSTWMLSITLPISHMRHYSSPLLLTNLDFSLVTSITGPPDGLWSIGNTSSGGPHLIYLCRAESSLEVVVAMYTRGILS